MNSKTDDLSRRVKVFKGDNAYRALKSCRDALYEPITMLQAINAPPGSEIYEKIITHGPVATISLKATGFVPGMSKVVVYAHIDDHYFARPGNIPDVDYKNTEPDRMKQSEFFSLYKKRRSKTVLVIDHKPIFSGVCELNYEQALKNPPFVAAVGGEQSVKTLFKSSESITFQRYSDHEAFQRVFTYRHAIWRFIAIGENRVEETSINQPHCFIGLETEEAKLKSELEEGIEG